MPNMDALDWPTSERILRALFSLPKEPLKYITVKDASESCTWIQNGGSRYQRKDIPTSTTIPQSPVSEDGLSTDETGSRIVEQ